MMCKISKEAIFREIIRKYPRYPDYVIKKMVDDELKRRYEWLSENFLEESKIIGLEKKRNNGLDYLKSLEPVVRLGVNGVLIDTNFNDNLEEKEEKSDSFTSKILRFEREKNKTFKEIYPWVGDEVSVYSYESFLYHGIRFGDQLEVLESIFKLGGIIASKYLDKYDYFLDVYENCNEGEYVSLLEQNVGYELEYDTFVKPNISLVVSPNCGAVKTFYLPYDEYRRLKIEFLDARNRYSYARGEYQVLERVPISMIRAIGVPYHYLKIIGNMELGEHYLEEVIRLMNLYGIDLPVVDTSYYNKELVQVKKLVK